MRIKVLALEWNIIIHCSKRKILKSHAFYTYVLIGSRTPRPQTTRLCDSGPKSRFPTHPDLAGGCRVSR